MMHLYNPLSCYFTMNKGNTLTKDEWKACIDCEDPIGKHSNIGDDNERCRHCYNKLK